MKRSEANESILWAKKVLEECHLYLPDFAHWTIDDWLSNREKTGTIQKVMLGWDVTDYGLGKFSELGGVLFTIRNGLRDDPKTGVPYAEKYMIFKAGQGLPVHFHFSKTEDIINRNGGVLALKLYNALPDFRPDLKSEVVVFRDGVQSTVQAGETVKIYPGNSITLTPYMYHKIWALEGAGDLAAGEVSSVNDDMEDNHFSESIPRFCDIEEDEPILHPLVVDYRKLYM